MTDAIIGFGQYVITARSQRGVVQQTRSKAASAVALAKQWVEAGYEAVQIVDPLGKNLSSDGYRGAIMQGARFYR
jgi:hypothetical protein